MGRGRRSLKKGVRKHGWFAAAIAALIAIILVGYALAPRSENNGTWHFPQIQPG